MMQQGPVVGITPLHVSSLVMECYQQGCGESRHSCTRVRSTACPLISHDGGPFHPHPHQVAMLTGTQVSWQSARRIHLSEFSTHLDCMSGFCEICVGLSLAGRTESFEPPLAQ